MKTKVTIIFILLFCVVFLGSLQAQDTTKTKDKTEHNQSFVDEDGDGYNDNAPDHDGDGIPNGLDPDWIKLKKEKKKARRFVDLDGDGINDNLQTGANGKQQLMGEQKKGSGSMDNKSAEQKRTRAKNQHGKD